MMNAFRPFGKDTEYNSETDERKREEILLLTDVVFLYEKWISGKGPRTKMLLMYGAGVRRIYRRSNQPNKNIK